LPDGKKSREEVERAIDKAVHESSSDEAKIEEIGFDDSDGRDISRRILKAFDQ
jgi:hypothetical protein